MTQDEAINTAQELLKTSNPSSETENALFQLEQYIPEEIFGDLVEALIAILPAEDE